MAHTVYITGDTHTDFTRFSTENFPEQKTMDKSDTVILCGDFGGLFDWRRETKEERYWLDWLDAKPFTTCFVDGNHECFPRLYALPEEERFGAPAGIVRDSVIWLKRGNIYTIAGRTFFTFGGASSHDMADGLLDPSDPNWKTEESRLKRQRKFQYRIRGRTWWEDEIEQDEAIYAAGLRNLEARGNSVDYIVTHCTCDSTQALLGFDGHDRMTGYLQTIHDTVRYGCWFFGHYHEDKKVRPREICLYEQIVRII